METTRKQLPLIILCIAFSMITNCTSDHVDHSERWTELQHEMKNTNNIINDETIVRFYENTSNSRKQAALLRLSDSLTIIDSCDCGSLYLFKQNPSFINENLDLEARLASSDGEVREEGDAFFNLTINMDTLFGNVSKEAVNKDTNTDYTEYNIIAVIDGGISNFDGLSDLLWVNKDEALGQDTIDNDGNCYVSDINGVDFTPSQSSDFDWHGTVVSYILKNSVQSNIDLALMDLRIFDQDGNGNLFDAICAIEYAIENKADYMNLSWGYYRDFDQNLAMRSDSLLLEYILKAAKYNIPIFSSAGNLNINTDGSPSYHYPSGFYSSDFYYPNNLISITSIDDDTNNIYEPDFGNTGENSVFISAKGRHIFNGNLVEGTSYATPFALAHSLNLTIINQSNFPLALKECLKSHSIPRNFEIKTEGSINTNNSTCP